MLMVRRALLVERLDVLHRMRKNHGAQAFQHLEEGYSEMAATIFATLDDRQQKMLCKAGSKLSSTQSLDNEQRNEGEKRTVAVNRCKSQHWVFDESLRECAVFSQRSRSELHLRQPALNKSAAEKAMHNKSAAEKALHNKSGAEKMPHAQIRGEI